MQKSKGRSNWLISLLIKYEEVKLIKSSVMKIKHKT